MRQEALVYFAVAGAVLGVTLVVRDQRSWVVRFAVARARRRGWGALGQRTLERAIARDDAAGEPGTGTAAAAGASLGTRDP